MLLKGRDSSTDDRIMSGMRDTRGGAVNGHRSGSATSRVYFVLLVVAFVTLPVAMDGGASTAVNASARPVADSVAELTSAELTELLRDPSIEIVHGLIRISERAPLGPPTPIIASTGDDGSSFSEHALTTSEVFQLNSRPGAERTILLDFDGQTVTAPHWNSGAPIEAAAYSFGDQTDENFSVSDRAAIYEIWKRVAEDFAAWDVNVTTQDPGAADLSMNWSVAGDPHGVRVVITPSYRWLSNQRYGGVAYVGSFDANYDLPAWVFSSNLSNGAVKSVAEAASHEAGHTLGLYHDGVDRVNSDGSRTTLDYYSGHGEWAPIMGIGYYRPVTQWSRGEYHGATNTEDDLSVIDGFLDRLPAVVASAAPAILGPDSSATEYRLTDGGDLSTHFVDVQSSPVTISVEKLDPEGNLLAHMTVSNPAGEIVGSAQPDDAATWTLNVTLPEGTASGIYTVEVKSRGWIPGVDAPASSDAADEGFSNYASFGGYRLSIAAPTGNDSPSTTPTTTEPPPEPPPEPQEPPPPAEPPAEGGDRLTAISPSRLLDTRSPDAAFRGPLVPEQEVRVAVAGAPDGTTAVVLNVTSAGPANAGFISVTPCSPTPRSGRTSSLNFSAGRSIANSVIVPISSSGDICLMSSQRTNVVLDVTGWIGEQGHLALMDPVTTRVVDTRVGTGLAKRLTAGSRTVISLADAIGDASVEAVALNVTAIRPSTGGFITVDDCNGGATATSSLNFGSGEVRGNNGVFALGAGQRLCIFTTATTDVTVDVTSEFGTGDGLTFVPISSPDRLVDTRSTGRLDGRTTISFDVDGSAEASALGRPPGAASVNLTATGHDVGGFVTSWDCGERPTTSALNPAAGSTTANGAIVPLTSSGRTCLFHANGGHLIVDLAGWWI